MNGPNTPLRALMGLCLLCLLIWPHTSPGEILTIDEDFFDTTYRDDQLTTANWDTINGTVSLHSQILFTRGSLNTTGAYASAMGSTHLFIADGVAGLRSVLVSDPDAPTSVDVVACDDQAKGLALNGNHAYVAVGGAGMQVIDISNPAAMVDRGAFDHNNELRYVSAVAVYDPVVYLAESDSGVAIFDVTTADSPVFVRHLESGSWARDVFVSGNHLYVADEGMKIFDLSSPHNPVLLSETPVEGTALRITVANGRAFVACGSSGLQIFDVSDPDNPQSIGSIDQWSSCQHATSTADGNTVFVAAGDQGLSVLDATDPEDITILGTRDTVLVALHVLYHEGLIHLANSSDGLKIYELDPGGLDYDLNRAQSLNLNANADPVSRVRLSTAHIDDISFEVTVNGGGLWHAIEPDSGWLDLDETGTDVRWRFTLNETEGGSDEGPTCHSLSLSMDRQSSNPEITSVGDVPADSGGKVRLSWQASRHDAPDGEHLISEYSIYRRYDGSDARLDQPHLAYPPGNWDFVATIPADQENQYATVVPTLADSNSLGLVWSVYFVRARTTEIGVFFDSAPDSGYSVNNLLPAPPTGLIVDRTPPDGNQLTWNPPSDPDFAHFRIYRSTQSGTPIQPGTLYAVTTDTDFFDETESLWYYQLTLVTFDGRESEPAGHMSSTPTAQQKLQMLPNHPNPFNPVTELKFFVPAGGETVRLDIFDARGRRVRTLLDQSMAEGWHAVSWDGRDESGRGCSSGVYQGRVRQGGNAGVVKMLLVR